MEKLNCWPGCLAEYVSGVNKGKRVVVLRDAENDGICYEIPQWVIRPLQPVVVYIAGFPESERVAMHDCVAADRILRPIPPLDEDDETDVPVVTDLKVSDLEVTF